MKLESIIKKLPEQVVEVLNNCIDEKELQALIANSEEAIATALRERDANPQYQAARQAVKDLSAGMREVKSYQGAKIQYALHRLRELNGTTEEESES